VEKEINDIDDLIGKVLAGEATEEEQLRLDNWIGLSDENRQYVEQIKIIFDRAASNTVQLSFDTDAAWNKVKTKLRESREDQRVFTMRHSRRTRFLRIAASIIMLMGVGLFAYIFLDRSKPQTFAFAVDSKVAQDTMPDGSTAFLNKRSSIAYEYTPGKKTRKVKLKGEGFFEVRHEEQKPFIIEAEEVLIRDIGTAFNVRAYPESDTIVVTVKTGEVQIYTLKDEGLNLKMGETGIYSKSLKQFTRLEKIDTNILSYKTGVFSFNSTNLKSVIEKINEVYDVKIKLDSPSLDKCPLTVNFHGDTIDTIVEVIAETLKLTVIKNGNEFILKGTGCNQ
jgi:transmembrane sensor